MKAIINAKLVLEGGRVECGSLLMENGRILAVGSFIPPENAEIVDANGRYAGPGYVDIHCHGGGLYRTNENPGAVAKYHLSHGTTSLCATLGYSLSKEALMGGIDRIRAEMEKGGSSLIGIHFEGPYTSTKRGARADLTWPKVDPADYMPVFEKADGIVRQVTYAPEREGIEPFEQYIAGKGYTMAVGHTDMSPEDLDRAVAAGATNVTHLFDAMGCWRGNDSIKETGVIQETAAEVALAKEGLYYELICDSRGVHVKPVNLRMTYRLAGPGRIVLVTDSTVHPPIDVSAFAEDDPRRSPDLNYNDRLQLSGSKLTMEMAAQNMQRHVGAAPEQIFRMASENPAKVVKAFGEVGSLAVGKKANVILCDGEMNIHSIYFEGELVARD